MKINCIDHLVLTVASIEDSVNFYTHLLGMRKEVFAGGRVALAFGEQKINLHQRGAEFQPNAQAAVPGSADLCFRVEEPVDQLKAELEAQGVSVIEGPIARTGALSPILSIYLRDPDGNLLELSNPLSDEN